MKSDYRGNLNRLDVTYDTSNNYFAAHLGIGKVNKVSEKGSLDIYTKLFYAYQEAPKRICPPESISTLAL